MTKEDPHEGMIEWTGVWELSRGEDPLALRVPV